MTVDLTNRELQDLLASMLKIVPVEGWSRSAYNWAVVDSATDMDLAKSMYPRGSMDLAVEFHTMGDTVMIDALDDMDTGSMRYSDRIAEAVWQRCLAYADHHEAMRRWIALYSLPMNQIEGSRLTWQTSDLIWRYFGDRSEDVNWHSKRMILSAVLGSSILYMIGGRGEEMSDTRAFIDRRISNVMGFEKFKARIRDNPNMKPVIGLMSRLTANIRRPSVDKQDFPGWTGRDS